MSHRLCTTQGCSNHLDLYNGHIFCFACLSERYFVPHKELKCQHCLSFNMSSYRARQMKRESLMEVLDAPGKGATLCGSYRIPLKQGSPHPVSSEDESMRGIPTGLAPLCQSRVTCMEIWRWSWLLGTTPRRTAHGSRAGR